MTARRWCTVLHNEKLHADVLKKIYKLGKYTTELPNMINVHRSTLQRMSKGKPIKIETFLKLTDWLEKEPSEYLKKELKNVEINIKKA